LCFAISAVDFIMRSLIMGMELAARYNYTEEGEEANGRTFEE
jgi:hypothetical protein